MNLAQTLHVRELEAAGSVATSDGKNGTQNGDEQAPAKFRRKDGAIKKMDHHMKMASKHLRLSKANTARAGYAPDADSNKRLTGRTEGHTKAAQAHWEAADAHSTNAPDADKLSRKADLMSANLGLLQSDADSKDDEIESSASNKTKISAGGPGSGRKPGGNIDPPGVQDAKAATERATTASQEANQKGTVAAHQAAIDAHVAAAKSWRSATGRAPAEHYDAVVDHAAQIKKLGGSTD